MPTVLVLPTRQHTSTPAHHHFLKMEKSVAETSQNPHTLTLLSGTENSVAGKAARLMEIMLFRNEQVGLALGWRWSSI